MRAARVSTLALIIATLLPATANAGACTGWHIVTSPNVTGDGYLRDVDASGPHAVWAVGYAGSSRNHTLILRFEGGSWHRQSSPNRRDANNYLFGVTVVGPNDAWAVGYSAAGASEKTLIERWNGTKWKVVPSPNVRNQLNQLYAVDANAPNDIWAVGNHSNGAVSRTLALHWNGTKWKRVGTENVGSGYNDFTGVVAITRNTAWAVGYRRGAGGDQRTLAERWNGTKWKVVAAKNVGSHSNELLGVDAFSRTNVAAVGDYATAGGNYFTLAERWNGSRWKVKRSSDRSSESNTLAGVAVNGKNNAWAVGSYSYGANTDTLIEHWNGSRWKYVISKNPGGLVQRLFGVAAVPHSGRIWAVGTYEATGSGTPFKPLIERHC